MALRNQPYLPLYVNDFLSDEKLVMCSAESTGVYIRLLCLMHKSAHYGKILLQQIHKLTEDNTTNFASVLTKQMPYEFQTVKKSLAELLLYKIIEVEGDMLVQKRMVKDNEISEKRALSGRKGVFAKANATAKQSANTEYENEVENVGLGGTGGKGWNTMPVFGDVGDLPEINMQAVKQRVYQTKGFLITSETIKSFWELWKVEKLTGKKYYASIEDVYSHFSNTAKDEPFKKPEESAVKQTISNTEKLSRYL